MRSVLISPAAAWQEVKGVCYYESDLPFPAWSEAPGLLKFPSGDQCPYRVERTAQCRGEDES